MIYSIPYVFIPFFVGCCAQFTKLCIDFFHGRSINRNTLWASGGFPSTHGTLTSSMMTVVFLVDGVHSTLFMVVCIISILFRYDATNVRYESGKHAQYINSLKKDLNQVFLFEHKDVDTTLPSLFLKERIGHTPVEVFAGILYGTMMTLLIHYFLNYFVY